MTLEIRGVDDPICQDKNVEDYPKINFLITKFRMRYNAVFIMRSLAVQITGYIFLMIWSAA